MRNTLQAQSESRNQHETFHNSLDRSREPFSVVAEYFGRGLFNKIVIVEEDDKATASNESGFVSAATNQVTQLNPYNAFGPGAESKIRLKETNVRNNNMSSTIRAIPLSEGRMRLQEQSRYSSSLEANISYQTPVQPKVESSNLKKSKANATNSISRNLVNKTLAKPSNPFDEDDDYDDTKNPFAEEAEAASENVKPNAGVGNPFGEYDSNLNPFS